MKHFYVYYSYEEYGRGYIGSRSCKCLPEEDVKYFGSSKDKAFKPTQKIILKSDYATREEAYADEIILQQYYKVMENPHFANKAYQTSTKFYYVHPFDKVSNFGKVQGKINYQNGVGIHALTSEQKSEVGKIGGKIGTQKCKELGVGIFAIPPEKVQERNKKNALQRWECLETGFVTNAGNLTKYQRARGIDTSKRKRVA